MILGIVLPAIPIMGKVLMGLMAAIMGGGAYVKHKRGMRELDLQEKGMDLQKTAGIRTGKTTERMTKANRQAAMRMRTEDITERRAERRETRQTASSDRETQMLMELIRMAMMPTAGITQGGQPPPSLTSLLGRS